MSYDVYTMRQTPCRVIQIKILSLLKGNPQNNDQILTSQMVFHYRHNNFYSPVTATQRDRRQRKQIINKETDPTATMLYSLKKEIEHERPKDKSTNKNKQTNKQKNKLTDNTHSLSPTQTPI